MNKQNSEINRHKAVLIDYRGHREEIFAMSQENLYDKIENYIEQSDVDLVIHEYQNGEKVSRQNSRKWSRGTN